MRHVDIAVIGGGITGRLVQHAIPGAVIFDWAMSAGAAQKHAQFLTRNFGANYLWEPIPGIPCTSFAVRTHVDGRTPTLDSVRAYKDKIGKTGDVVGWERQFAEETIGYEFVALPTADIAYGHRAETIDRLNRVITFQGKEPVQYTTLVSTVPLYVLLKMVGMPLPVGGLRASPIFVRMGGRPLDAPFPIETMYVNYLSDPDVVPYRYCDRFGERHYESIHPYVGGTHARILRPGKIHPNPVVPQYLDVLASFGIQTFGRFGSWAPNELVHESWQRITAWKESM